MSEFDNSQDIFLEEDIAALDEVLIVADPRPTDGNGIVVRAMERLDRNMPDQPYLQKGFFYLFYVFCFCLLFLSLVLYFFF